MEFIIQKPRETVISLARALGYRPMGVDERNEYNIVRPLSRQGYPRFHIFIKKDNEGNFRFSLHLDQKQQSYEGSHAHSGEYDGETVEKEAERIKRIVGELN
jgi:hypothetical protein